MLALSFGLMAAVLWAVHDLLARKLSQGTALLPILTIVLATGVLGHVPVAVWQGGWEAMTGLAWGVAALSGIAAAAVAVLVAAGHLPKDFHDVPAWIILASYFCMAFGTAIGGWRRSWWITWDPCGTSRILTAACGRRMRRCTRAR